jgi:hypothetical protein
LGGKEKAILVDGRIRKRAVLWCFIGNRGSGKVPEEENDPVDRTVRYGEEEAEV